MKTGFHKPVLLKEVLEALSPKPGGKYIDCTVGSGGHAKAILERIVPEGRLLGIDIDPEAIELSAQNLRQFGSNVNLVNADYAFLEEIAPQYGFEKVDGILFDLGIASFQLENGKRGFSFNIEGPLDMRYNPHQQSLTAAEVVNTYHPKELARILREFGEEPRAWRIAQEIAKARKARDIETTLELARIVEKVYGGREGFRIHPATRTLLALRIFINRELEKLELGLRQAIKLLASGGRIVVITFHSLEDRLVKRFFEEEAKNCICPPRIPQCVCGHRASLKIITKKPIRTSEEEKEENPRSRSAKMRVAEKI